MSHCLSCMCRTIGSRAFFVSQPPFWKYKNHLEDGERKKKKTKQGGFLLLPHMSHNLGPALNLCHARCVMLCAHTQLWVTKHKGHSVPPKGLEQMTTTERTEWKNRRPVIAHTATAAFFYQCQCHTDTEEEAAVSKH